MSAFDTDGPRRQCRQELMRMYKIAGEKACLTLLGKYGSVRVSDLHPLQLSAFSADCRATADVLTGGFMGGDGI